MDLRNVILLSSSPVLPQQRPVTSLPAKTSNSRPEWINRHLLGSDTAADLPVARAGDFVVLEATSDLAADDGPRPSQAYSKYFGEPDVSLSVHSIVTENASQNAAEAVRSKPAAYVSGDLEMAVQRRRDWTPPPIDTVAAPGSELRHDIEDWSSSPGDILSRRRNVFQSLQTSFGCRADDVPTADALATMTAADSVQTKRPTKTVTQEPIFIKRKAIEAISIGDTGRKTSPTKPKVPKKVRTLTELAVAAYADVPPDTHGALKAAKDKRQPEVIDESVPLTEVEVRHRFPTSNLRKLKSATAAAAAAKKSKPRARKAATSRKQILLSPVSARAASNAQDFLFGTSSQLASEHSPTFLRHLHTAMHESNQRATSQEIVSNDDAGRNRLLDILADMSSEADIPTVDLTGQRTPGLEDKKRLWGAAARGTDGHLSFNNVVNLEDAIEFPEDPHQVIAMAQRAAAETMQKPDTATIPAPTSTANSAPTQKPRATQRARGKGEQRAKATASQAQHSGVQAEIAEPPSPVQTSAQTDLPVPLAPTPVVAPTMASVAKAAKATKSKKAVKVKEAVRPNFDILTTAQLAKKVSDYGYKAMKARTAMIALLNQCWEAQHLPPPVQSTGTASVPLSATAPASTSAPAPALTPAQNAATAVNDKASTQAQSQIQSEPKVVRAVKPRVTRAMPASKVTQTTISGLTTLPRSSTSNKKTAAPYHTAVEVPTGPPAKPTARTIISSKTGRRVFEIDDSESDGRFSSPEPTTRAGAATPSSLWGLVETEEEVVGDSDFQDIDDIIASDLDDSDSNSDCSSENDMSLVADAPLSYEESALFQYIYTAVMQQPRTLDPTAPSWHEKMLMYDTIILESFTAWLNDGPLQAAGYAGTAVDPPTVKKWCEAKSVCCIWRKNQHGKERKW
ncbi:5'-flap endonuclease [Sporothrix epigloea]|uniref:Structure-specific endonuclease subunit SLX4 n=1 Tax=Sporothrix epigloea TaxID=1892477 RepID=A0ABP0E2Z4_9PEZI